MKLKALEPRTVTLAEGVTVTLAPLTRGDLMAAMREAQPTEGGPDADDLFAEALAVRQIKGWEGIVGDDDAPLECTPDNIRWFVRSPETVLFVAVHIIAPANAVVVAKNG